VPLEYWKRIDKFGVTQPNIQKLESGQILVELPGAKDVDRIEIITKYGSIGVLKRTRLKKWVIS
jgi:preprotein translocase subunit SecD